MKQNLYRVSLKNKRTNETLQLLVWSDNVDNATHSLCGILIGYNCEYSWIGSGPVYENNQLVTREI